MRTLSRPLVLGGILLVLLAGATGSVARQVASKRDPRAVAAGALARSPLAFQPEGSSRFVARMPGYGVTVSPEGATVSGYLPDPGAARGQRRPDPLRLRLDGADTAAAATGRQPLSGRANMFLGDDPSGWQTDVTTYGQVDYRDVWNGIDVVWHGNGAHLEQDFVVAPGADPDQIGLSFPDARTVAVGDAGDLVVRLPDGDAHLAAPTLYQDTPSGRRNVVGGFVLRGGGRVGFTVGARDSGHALVIDPVLVESTFLGGRGGDAGYGVAVDAGSNVYVTGSTESVDFPVAGPVQSTLMQVNDVRTDAFVAKIKADGSGFVYSTFLGGKGRDVGYAIAVGFDGSAYVSGSTESPDFPTSRPVQKAYGGGTTDAFVTKLGPQGAVLAYSTYLGGGGNDVARGVAVDGSGNAYVVGTTSSNDFPTAGSPLQATPNHPDDTAAFVTSVNVAGSAWNYSTYLGGSGDDRATAVAVDPAGEAFVTGDTRSADFPLVRPFQANPGSPLGIGAAKAESFLVKLPASGSPLVYSSFLGGSGSDLATGVAVDLAGAAYVTGTTDSLNFPTVKALQGVKGAGFDAFVSKVDPGGAALVYSTFLGGSAADAGAGITVTADDHASVTGTTASDNFPVAKAVRGTKAGFIDAFVATLTPSGGGLVQSTYLGGRDDDNATAIAADRSGTLYLTGYTRSADFPLVAPLRPVTGGTDAFVATVGDRATGSSAEATSPARERRIRAFGVLTAVLFLAAFAQTLWLRRRPSPDLSDVPDAAPAIPGMVVIPAASQAEPEWYTPRAPRLSELPPVRPRAVPGVARRASKPTAPVLVSGDVAIDGVTGGDVVGGAGGNGAGGDGAGGDVAVPDLLPPEADVDWSRDQPNDDDFWLTDDRLSDDDAPRSVDVQAPDLWGPIEPEEVAAAGNLWGPGPDGPVDVQAPDLWGPADSDEDLAIDPMWAELLAAPAPGPLPEPEPIPEPEPVVSEADDVSWLLSDEWPSPAPAAPKRRASRSGPRKSSRHAADSDTPAKPEPAQAEPIETSSVLPPPPPAPRSPSSKSAGPKPKPNRRERAQAASTSAKSAVPQPEPTGGGPAAEQDWISELWPETPLKAGEAKAMLGDEIVPDAPSSGARVASTDPDTTASTSAPGELVLGTPTPDRVGAEAVPVDELEAAPRGWLGRRRAARAESSRLEAELPLVPPTGADEATVPPAVPAPPPPRSAVSPPPPVPPPPRSAVSPPPPAPAPRQRSRPASPTVAAPSAVSPPPPDPAPRRRSGPAPVVPALSSPPPPPPDTALPQPTRQRRRRRTAPPADPASPSPSALPTPPPSAEADVVASIAPDAGRQVPDALVPEPTQPERPEFGPPVSEPAPDRKRLLAPPDNAGPPDWEALVDDALPAAEESLVVGITSGALPDEDRKVVEAGLADLVGNVDLADLPAGFAAGTLDGPRGIAPLEDPAVAEALAHELSISDLLAEDLAIPETAVDRDELSLSELLAEDLTIPDAGGAGEAQPSVVKPELPTPDDHPVSEQPSTGSTSGRNGPRGRDDTSLDSAPAADPDPGADAAPAPDTDTDTGDGDGPDTTPSKPTYRQLPEARPGIMRGLRAGWNRPRE